MVSDWEGLQHYFPRNQFYNPADGLSWLIIELNREEVTQALHLSGMCVMHSWSQPRRICHSLLSSTSGIRLLYREV